MILIIATVSWPWSNLITIACGVALHCCLLRPEIMWPLFCSAAFAGSSLLMNRKRWKNPMSLRWPLFHFKKICRLINTLGCVSIHYSILQLMNTWHGESEMGVFFPSVLMLISSSNQKSHRFHPFRGDKSTKQKIILLNIKIYRLKC